jgi:hypothetical protein
MNGFRKIFPTFLSHYATFFAKMAERKVVPFDEFYYQLKLMHLFLLHPVLCKVIQMYFYLVHDKFHCHNSYNFPIKNITDRYFNVIVVLYFLDRDKSVLSIPYHMSILTT